MWWVSFQETGDFADIPHLFHFLELIMVFFAQKPNPDKVSHITFPQWKGDSWKGKNEINHNEWILKRMYPGVVFHDRDEEGPVAIIDRASLDGGNISKAWCKYIRHFDPYLWAKTLKIPKVPSRHPVVTYVSRQSARVRTLDPQVHENFVHSMSDIKGIEFVVVKMETLPFDKQFELANKTDLLIGVHGNGLSHAAFMRPHRNVIEIFVPGTIFEWDYYTLSKMMGHEYMCIFNSSPCLPHMFVKNRWARCTTCASIPIEPISAVIDQIKEEH